VLDGVSKGDHLARRQAPGLEVRGRFAARQGVGPLRESPHRARNLVRQEPGGGRHHHQTQQTHQGRLAAVGPEHLQGRDTGARHPGGADHPTVVEDRVGHEHAQTPASPDAGDGRLRLVADPPAHHSLVTAREGRGDLVQVLETHSHVTARRGHDAAVRIHDARARQREDLGAAQGGRQGAAGGLGRGIRIPVRRPGPRRGRRTQHLVGQVQGGFDGHVAIVVAPRRTEAPIALRIAPGCAGTGEALRLDPVIAPGLPQPGGLHDQRAFGLPRERGVHEGQREDGHHRHRQDEQIQAQQQVSQGGAKPHSPSPSRIR